MVATGEGGGEEVDVSSWGALVTELLSLGPCFLAPPPPNSATDPDISTSSGLPKMLAS